MFTRYFVALCTIIGIFLIAASQGQTKHCAKNNEYCQNHWDCCSNTCMTYLYKCMAKPQFYPYTFFGGDYPVSSTYNELLETNFGRSAAAPQMPLRVASRFSNDIEDEADGILLDVNLLPATSVVAATTAAVGKEQAIPSGVQNRIGRTQKNEIEAAAVGNAKKEEAVELKAIATEPVVVAITTETMPIAEETKTAAVGQCKEIGLKCYTNDECCSKRCHGFLHQCVT